MLLLESFNHITGSSCSPEELPIPSEKKSFKKGHIITEYGQVEDFIFFLERGIVEMTIKSYTSEKIIDFFFQGEVFTSITSFLTRVPTDTQITALADSDIEAVRYDHLMKAYEHSLEANIFGRVLTEQGLIRKSNREKDFLTKTAEERYAQLLEKAPQYVSNISVNRIAKYLGIHPESLSRIRNKMNT